MNGSRNVIDSQSPMRCAGVYKLTFSSSPPVVYDGPQAYWMYFLAKYVSKGKFGAYTGSTAKDAAYERTSSSAAAGGRSAQCTDTGAQACTAHRPIERRGAASG
jgi:hypothetical protein